MPTESYDQRVGGTYPSGVNIPLKKKPSRSYGFSIRNQERIGSLIAAAGVVWFVYITTSDLTSFFKFDILPSGPMELCGLGILLWLHAKYRRSTKLT